MFSVSRGALWPTLCVCDGPLRLVYALAFVGRHEMRRNREIVELTDTAPVSQHGQPT